MSDQFSNEPILDVYIFETSQNVERLEQIILNSENEHAFSQTVINEIFRIMHTIKGSSSMMMFNEIATLAHAIEDIFFLLRENNPQHVDCRNLSDLVLEGVDFIKLELEKIKNNDQPDGQAADLLQSVKELLSELKGGNIAANQPVKPATAEDLPQSKQNLELMDGNTFTATIHFEDGCEMENIRAFTIVHNLKDISEDVEFDPPDIIDNQESANLIRQHGFRLRFHADRTLEEIRDILTQTAFLKDLEVTQLDRPDSDQLAELTAADSSQPVTGLQSQAQHKEKEPGHREISETANSVHQQMISVDVAKLDKLMDLVGELVIAEAMVTQNPDLNGLELDNFTKAARQLRKINDEIQDTVMSIRMVPLAPTFQKMQRVVRDMSKKLGKEVRLDITGEKTEVDKNIIEHISDPLMHLVRNAIDHGIEDDAERLAKGKPVPATVTLDARNSGSDVLIMVKDNGKGLDKERILQTARDNGLLHQPESELSDRDIYNLIFLPGFSTKDKVTEFSGRGVGMDVVVQNITTIGGSVFVDSSKNEGTTVTLKIPLTLAIVDGINIRVGESRYTLPTTGITESFRPRETDIIVDPDGNEMIMVRGQCYPIVKLHQLYHVNTGVTSYADGILIMLQHDNKSLCLFVDELLGQQQVVVKALPNYIKHIRKTDGLAGCTLLGDGTISLILDISGIIDLGRQRSWQN